MRISFIYGIILGFTLYGVVPFYVTAIVALIGGLIIGKLYELYKIREVRKMYGYGIKRKGK